MSTYLLSLINLSVTHVQRGVLSLTRIEGWKTGHGFPSIWGVGQTRKKSLVLLLKQLRGWLEPSLMNGNGIVVQWHTWKGRGRVLLGRAGEEPHSSRWEDRCPGVMGFRLHTGSYMGPGPIDLTATKLCVVEDRHDSPEIRDSRPNPWKL